MVENAPAGCPNPGGSPTMIIHGARRPRPPKVRCRFKTKPGASRKRHGPEDIHDDRRCFLKSAVATTTAGLPAVVRCDSSRGAGRGRQAGAGGRHAYARMDQLIRGVFRFAHPYQADFKPPERRVRWKSSWPTWTLTA